MKTSSSRPGASSAARSIGALPRAAVLAAGCAAPGASGSRVVRLPADTGSLSLGARACADADAARTARCVFADRREHEEHAVFRGGGARAEVIHASVLASPLALAGDGPAGNPEFPFRFAVRYRDTDGGGPLD